MEYFDVSPDNPCFSGRDGVLFDKAQSTLIRYPRGIRDIEREIAENSKEPILLDHYTIPYGITNIGTYAFSRSYALTNIVIPASVGKIEPYAFYMCTNLQQISIPDAIPSIPPGAFSRCINLHSADIGSGVNHIYPFAFSSCRSLTTLRFKGYAPENSDGFVDDWHRITVYHLDGSEGWNTLVWNDKSKRLWNPYKITPTEDSEETKSEDESGTDTKTSESENKTENPKDNSTPQEPAKE